MKLQEQFALSDDTALLSTEYIKMLAPGILRPETARKLMGRTTEVNAALWIWTVRFVKRISLLKLLPIHYKNTEIPDPRKYDSKPLGQIILAKDQLLYNTHAPLFANVESIDATNIIISGTTVKRSLVCDGDITVEDAIREWRNSGADLRFDLNFDTGYDPRNYKGSA